MPSSRPRPDWKLAAAVAFATVCAVGLALSAGAPALALAAVVAATAGVLLVWTAGVARIPRWLRFGVLVLLWSPLFGAAAAFLLTMRDVEVMAAPLVAVLLLVATPLAGWTLVRAWRTKADAPRGPASAAGE